MRFRQLRLELDRAPAVLDPGAEVAETMQHVSEVGVQPPITRRPLERVAIAACRGLIAPEPRQQRCILVEGFDARIVRQQSLVVGDRLRSSTGGAQRASELRDGGGKLRPQLNCPSQARDRRLLFAGLEERAAEVSMGLRKSGLERDHAPVPRDRRRERATRALGVGEIAEGRCEARTKRERALAARDRRVRPFQPQQHLA